jgi:hypothetical protein
MTKRQDNKSIKLTARSAATLVMQVVNLATNTL